MQDERMLTRLRRRFGRNYFSWNGPTTQTWTSQSCCTSPIAQIKQEAQITRRVSEADVKLSGVPNRRLSIADIFFAEEIQKIHETSRNRSKSKDARNEPARDTDSEPAHPDREESGSPHLDSIAMNSRASSAGTEKCTVSRTASCESLALKKEYLLYTDAAHLVIDR